MKTYNLLISSVLLLGVLSAGAFESAPSLIFVGSTYSGHEEITRQALNNTAKRIKLVDTANPLFELSDLSFDLAPEAKGLFGYKSKNMIIHGNFATDFPKQTTVLSLAKFWNNNSLSDFENPESQVLHFLKNHKNKVTLASARATCLTARENIKHITTEALKAWERNEKSQALFLLGHATHTIQDSFSPAHTVRAGADNNYNLKNICFYGTVMSKNMDMSRRGPKDLCFHSAPDSKDAIWNSSPDLYKKTLSNWSSEQSIQCDKQNSYPETDEQKSACMNDEARLARVATEKYLFLVFGQISPQNFVKRDSENFVAGLDANLFDGPVGEAELDQKMVNGILRCEGLPDNEIVGYETPSGN